MYKWLTDLKVINGIRFIIRRLEISMAMALRHSFGCLRLAIEF